MRRSHSAVLQAPAGALTPRSRRGARTFSRLAIAPRLTFRTPSELLPIALLGGLALLTILGRESPGLLLLVGSSAAAAAVLGPARRGADDRSAWVALLVAWIGMAFAGSVLWLLPLAPAQPVFGLVESGLLVFATAAGTANLAWPEIRRTSLRLFASLVDTVTLVSAVGVWGSTGFAPFGANASSPERSALAHATMLSLPIITAAIAFPQVRRSRRRLVIATGLAASAFLLGDLAGKVTVSPLWTLLAVIVRTVGMGTFLWVAFTRSEDAADQRPLIDDVGMPPYHAPGLLGVVAVAASAAAATGTAAPVSGFVGALVVCLAVREALRWAERRRADQLMLSSLDLESRLLTLQAEAGGTLHANEALRQTCTLSVEVLRADTVLAWTVEGESLTLSAVAPTRRERLLGRRLALTDADALAVRVFGSRSPEGCEVGSRSARYDRLLSTILDAGSILGAPIMLDGKAIGTLVLVRERGNGSFSRSDQQKAALIATQAASALRRFELIEERENQLRQTTLVHRFVVGALSARNVNDIGWSLLESIRSHVSLERAAVYLVEPSLRSGVTPIAHFHPRDVGSLSFQPEAEHLRLSLQYGDRTLGYVDCFRCEGEPFLEGEQNIVERLCQQATIAIQNLRLQEESGKVSTYRELDRLKTDLLNSVSHDLRGPLANIKGYASTLVDAAEDMPRDEQLAFLQTIESESDRLRDLLEHLLDLSKIEAGVLHVDLQPTNLARIIQQTLASATRSTHTYEVDVPPETFVFADARRLRQVLHNLVENAIKYAPNGGSIRIRAGSVNGDVIVSVADCGVGIPRHHWDRIFRPYQRAERNLIAGISGTGLGLAICKGIVEAHGGRIWVESEPGMGSTFSFTVRRAPTPEEVDAVAA